MRDEHAQYLILLGDLCLAAGLAQLPVEIETLEGARYAGVPTGVRARSGEGELDHTGFGHTMHLGRDEVRLEEVTACAVRAPVPDEGNGFS